MKSQFTSRLRIDLFPEMPESFHNRIHDTLRSVGVKPRTIRPWQIAATTVAAVSAAAALVLVLIGTFRNPQDNAAMPGTEGSIEPTSSVQWTSKPDETSVPHASMDPNWTWNTKIFYPIPASESYSEQDTERFATLILAYLRESGESEPDELWILGIKPLTPPLSPTDLGNYMSSVLVLAQSDFGNNEGPRLYCLSSHRDGCVLWATESGPSGPCKAQTEAYGQTMWFLYGTNPMIDEPAEPHVTRGVITDGSRNTEIEFSMLQSHQELEEKLASSAYTPFEEYFLVTVSEHDWEDSVKERRLIFETEEDPVEVDIATDVPEILILPAVTETQNEMQPTPVSQKAIQNLTPYSDQEAIRYGSAILDRLNDAGIKLPESLWICGAMPLAFPEDAPTDRAYVLAQYTFDGETGPELFFYQDGKIKWMTNGYDPFRINTVYDPDENLILVFGASFAYDNGPIEMREGKVSLTDGSEEVFSAQLPLKELEKLGLPKEWTSEYYLCAFSAKQMLKSIEITAKDGHVFFPFDQTENRLDFADKIIFW